MTKEEIKVLAACIRWWKACADKDSTDELWKLVCKMCGKKSSKP